MRQVPSAGNLAAEVEGDIEDVSGLLKITRIRVHYRLKAPPEAKEKIDRVLAIYADACPAYQSVRGCIGCSWDLEIVEE